MCDSARSATDFVKLWCVRSFCSYLPLSLLRGDFSIHLDKAIPTSWMTSHLGLRLKGLKNLDVLKTNLSKRSVASRCSEDFQQKSVKGHPYMYLERRAAGDQTAHSPRNPWNPSLPLPVWMPNDRYNGPVPSPWQTRIWCFSASSSDANLCDINHCDRWTICVIKGSPRGAGRELRFLLLKCLPMATGPESNWLSSVIFNDGSLEQK